MRKSLIIVLCGLMATTLSFGKAQSIKGSMKGIEVYSYIYLYELFGPEVSKVDSVKHLAGAFEFKRKEALPRGIFRVGVNDKIQFEFVNDQSNLILQCDAATPGKAAVSNSKENDLYQQYSRYNKIFNDEFAKLNQQAQANAGLQQTDPAEYTILITKLQAKLDSLNRDLRSGLNSIVSNNKGTFMAKISGMFLFTDTITPQYFFTKAELSDPEYTRGDFLTNKVYQCMQRFYSNVELNVGVSQLMSRFDKATPNKEVFYISVIRGVYQQNQEYARTVAEQYKKEFPASRYANYYVSVLPKPAPKVGDEVPDIKLKDFMGKEVALSSLKGKVVLLDFWASWCGPCRKENPNVVRAYNKYKEKGFTVFSVSLDDNRDRWVAAIQQDQLVWENHVSDLKGWNSSAAKLYGVKSIPATYLLDKSGKIVATNLRGAELEMKLEQLLAQ
jgi:peroxiredoxin